MTPIEEQISQSYDLDRVRHVAESLRGVLALRDTWWNPDAQPLPRKRTVAEIEAVEKDLWSKHEEEIMLLALAALDADRFFHLPEDVKSAWREHWVKP